ncbi:MAG: LemA family protein [Kiritimatiellae bacterium]|jgi:LemA protein|nr:LemA family protein [Kiritimatiellia bacterium]
MKTGTIVLIGIAVVILFITMNWISVYNKIVTYDENIDGSWAQVENVLQRRYDLIPNLVNTVKGYAAHEKGTLEEITKLRSQWGAAKTKGEQVAAANQMESALSRLMVVVERYPDLKANQNFLALQDELAGTENRIAVERGRYNGSVKMYNTYIRRVPASFYANIAGFEKSDEYFKADQGAAAAPKVEF